MGSKATEDFTFCHTQLFQIGSYTPETHFQPFSLRQAGLKAQHCWQFLFTEHLGRLCAQVSSSDEPGDCPAPARSSTPCPLPIACPWPHLLPMGTPCLCTIKEYLTLASDKCFHLELGNGTISDFSSSWSWPTLPAFCSGLKWSYGKQMYLWVTKAALCLTATKQVSLWKKYCRIRSSVSEVKYFV